MKKAIMTSVLCVSVGFFTLSFAETKMPVPEPDALWQYITKTSPYTNWSFWGDHQGMQKGRAPHGPLHKVYVNEMALSSKKAPVQFGAIEVKENYGKDESLKAITVMYKVEGYNPSDGDWFWAKYNLDGSSDKYGKVSGCISCHSSRIANDYILVHEFE